MIRSRIIAILTLAIFLAPMSAAAQVPYRETAIALERSSLSNVGNWLGEYQGQEI